MRSRALLVAGLVVVGLLTPSLAAAQAVPAPPPPPSRMRSTSMEDLARDLDSESPGIRGFAARELRRQARNARRQFRRSKPGSIERDEARILLADLRSLVLPSAIECVGGTYGIRGTCAQILGAIGDARAVRPLMNAREAASEKGKKKIDKAIAAIEEAA